MRTLSIALTLFAFVGCGGGALRDARHAVEYGAIAGSEADRILASQIIEAHPIAAETSKDAKEYEQKMSGYGDAVDALLALRAALKTAEAGLDVWEATGSDADWRASAGCIAVAIAQAGQAFEVIGVEPPDALAEFSRLALNFGDAFCKGGLK